MTTKEWPPKGSPAELDTQMQSMSIEEMDKEIIGLESELHEKEHSLQFKIKLAKERRQRKQREGENKIIPFGMSEEDFQTCMGWHGGRSDEYSVELTIGQMNLLHEAVETYNKNEISKWDETEKDCNSAYGFSEYDCNEIKSKIRNVQLKLFESMGKDHIRWTQYHQNLCGTIQ